MGADAIARPRRKLALATARLYFNFVLLRIQAGWKENLATFMNELKNLQATGLTNLGAALKQAFDLLNLYRLQSGIDNYGMVRIIR